MAETKKITNWGWVTAEKQMIKKFEKNALDGWVPESIAAKGNIIIMKKVQPQELQYAIDWQPKLDDEDEYIAIYRAAGWELVLRDKMGFYIFSAASDAIRPHTDRELLKQLRKERLKKYTPYVFLYLFICIALLIFVRVVAMPIWVVLLLCIPGAFCAANLGVL
ncbi:DUF2812 domain-containing protein, partial [Ruminococcaceae bacterium OttesenSCG-928-D13]|nr:DUF2812 domain-containing protein [Ruminococcaceae bacterium OttesenSCG-928-D13]